jgi:hypothetical protein
MTRCTRFGDGLVNYDASTRARSLTILADRAHHGGPTHPELAAA